MGPSILRCEALSVSYRKSRALSNVTLAVGAGERVGVLGHNGSGRTTLLKALVGLVKSSGQVFLEEERIDGLPAHQRVVRGLSMVMEGAGFVGGLRVEEHLALFVRMHPKTSTARLKEVYAAFPRLAERKTLQSRNLSGGERQMLKIGSALLQDPKVLLLDEPTAGLAPVVAHELAMEVRRICDDRGIAVLVAEQSPEFVRSFADRVVVLSGGGVQLDTELDDHSYAKVLEALGFAGRGALAEPAPDA